MEKTSMVPSIVWRLAWLVVGFIVAHVVVAQAGETTPASRAWALGVR